MFYLTIKTSGPNFHGQIPVSTAAERKIRGANEHDRLPSENDRPSGGVTQGDQRFEHLLVNLYSSGF